jgi:CheY-like chemotaxis protein
MRFGANNGLEALNFLADSPRKPSLILLDLMMPILDGWTFCKVRQGVFDADGTSRCVAITRRSRWTERGKPR